MQIKFNSSNLSSVSNNAPFLPLLPPGPPNRASVSFSSLRFLHRCSFTLHYFLPNASSIYTNQIQIHPSFGFGPPIHIVSNSFLVPGFGFDWTDRTGVRYFHFHLTYVLNTLRQQHLIAKLSDFTTSDPHCSLPPSRLRMYTLLYHTILNS